MFHVTGVVTDGTAPLEGARVLQGGGAVQAVTGPDGRFDIVLSTDFAGTPTLVAAKEGYRSAGLEMPAPDPGDVELVLREVMPPDGTGYVFGDPGTGDPAHDNSTVYCGHCHTGLVAQFQTSAHAKATRDPWVQDVYAGTALALDPTACAARGGVVRAGTKLGSPGSAASKCYVGAGVLPDLNACGGPGDKACDDPSRAVPPVAFGGCADCHAPGIDGPGIGGPGGRNLHDASGIAYANGNHCDVCHHIGTVTLGAAPGIRGALSLQRPHDKQDPTDPTSKSLQAMFGPLADVPNPFMGGVYTPHFETSELCGGCHEDHQPALAGGVVDPVKWPDGLPVHSTYTEWKGSAFGTPGTTCQFCHMPAPSAAGFNSVDVGTPDDAGVAFGFARPPEDRREHTFLGPLAGTPRLIDGALSVGATATQVGATLEVEAKVTNSGAGHAIPTGEPMRGLLLVVRASCTAPLRAIGGQTLSDVAGARATAILGADASVSGTSLTWTEAAARAKPGDEIRVVRASGAFDDYAGNGWFAGSLTPAEKGIPILEPVAAASVVSVSGSDITLSLPIAASPGDILFLGDPSDSLLSDGAPALDLAGVAGNAFAKVLVDATGARLVPHYKAVHIASDNRVPPQSSQLSRHVFALEPGCTAPTVVATLLYRPSIGPLAHERGWDARSFVVGQVSFSIATAP